MVLPLCLNKGILPKLDQLARKYLSIQSSETASESMYSKAALTNSALRNRMTVKIFSMLNFEKLNKEKYHDY